MKYFIILFFAILAETVATISLKMTQGFTRVLPVIGVVIGYAMAFLCLGVALKHIKVSLAYAIWCGAGIMLITLFSYLIFKEIPDFFGIGGILLILSGIVLIMFFSEVKLN